MSRQSWERANKAISDLRYSYNMRIFVLIRRLFEWVVAP